MKFSPKINIEGLKQEVFKAIRLCEAICANYHVEMLVSHISGPQNKFAINTRNMRGAAPHIYEDIVDALDGNFLAENHFGEHEKNPQIIVIME